MADQLKNGKQTKRRTKKLKCAYCGNLIEESELPRITEEVGDTHYTKTYVDDTCSCCGSQYEEAFVYDECGKYYTEEELNNDICYECLDKIIEANVYDFIKQENLKPK